MLRNCYKPCCGKCSMPLRNIPLILSEKLGSEQYIENKNLNVEKKKSTFNEVRLLTTYKCECFQAENIGLGIQEKYYLTSRPAWHKRSTPLSLSNQILFHSSPPTPTCYSLQTSILGSFSSMFFRGFKAELGAALPEEVNL